MRSLKGNKTMFRFKRKGQTTIEYTLLLIIIMGALLTASNYIKRGIQGRWKSAVDEVGDQYDHRFANGSILHSLLSNSITLVTVINSTNGVWTFRTDTANSVETKTGFMAVGAY